MEFIFIRRKKAIINLFHLYRETTIRRTFRTSIHVLKFLRAINNPYNPQRSKPFKVIRNFAAKCILSAQIHCFEVLKKEGKNKTTQKYGFSKHLILQRKLYICRCVFFFIYRIRPTYLPQGQNSFVQHFQVKNVHTLFAWLFRKQPFWPTDHHTHIGFYRRAETKNKKKNKEENNPFGGR